MGLFDGIKLAAGMVKGGIDLFKATEQMDKLIERSRTEYGKLLSPELEKLYQAYTSAKEANEAESDPDKSADLNEKEEAAQVTYLVALEEDAKLPKEYRAEITLALQEYRRCSDAPMELLDKFLMSKARTDEEKEVTRQILDEVKQEMAEETAQAAEEAKNGG